jgi:hypothetical protein
VNPSDEPPSTRPFHQPPVEGTMQQVGLPPTVRETIRRDQPEIPGY